MENKEEILYTKKGEVRKRKPKTSIDYFNGETEQAIMDYVASQDSVEKNKLYSQKIHPALYKLSENIIHTFKFYYNDTETIEEMKHELIIFLISKFHLYKPEKGKAYSYFGTAAKRYMIRNNIVNYQKLQDKMDVDDFEKVEEDKKYLRSVLEESERVDVNGFISYYVEQMDKNIDIVFPKLKDRKTANAILELFKKRETLEVFNKKALYIYIREISGGIDTAQITKIIKKLKTMYSKLYNVWYEKAD